MRILFLTPQPPWPTRSGGLIKTRALVEHLRLRADVELVCLATLAAQKGEAPLPRPRSLGSLVRSLALGLPLSVYRNWSPAVAQEVRQRLGQGFDAVVADHIYAAAYLPADFPGRRILHLHNVESLLWQQEAQMERDPLRRSIMALEARRLRRYEATQGQRFHRVFAVSEEERRELLALGLPPERCGVLPNVPAPHLLQRPPLLYQEAEARALYLGTLSWWPNQRGLRWFLAKGLPHLRRLVPGAVLTVAGNGPPAWLSKAARHLAGVELRAGPDEAGEEALYRSARAFLEPVLGGAGTKVKVLNALARGLPVASTPDGVRGLEAVPGQHLLVADHAQGLAEAVALLLNSPSRWRELAEAGRALVQERYQPEIAFRPLWEALGLT